MKLGITGGIASGKSTVVKMLKDLGVAIVDADEISRKLTAPGKPLAKKIIEVFGGQYSVPNQPGTLDRAKLGVAVFDDPALRRKLESTTHPSIVDEIQCQIDELTAKNPRAVIAVEVPLLYEICFETLVDRVLVVWCTLPTQRDRLKERMPSLTENEMMARILSQMPLDEKRARADFVINSEKPVDAMQQDVVALFDLLK